MSRRATFVGGLLDGGNVAFSDSLPLLLRTDGETYELDGKRYLAHRSNGARGGASTTRRRRGSSKRSQAA
jgi:hypothetical protein